MHENDSHTKCYKLNQILILLLVLLPSLVSCKEKLRKNHLPRKNPVEYVYSISKDSLYKIISSKLNVENMMLFDANHKDMVLTEISNLLNESSNKSDFCLMPLYYIGKSKVYLKENGDSLYYIAWFYIHLENIGNDRSSVSIKTFEPKIIIGKESVAKPPHFVKADKQVSVDPTTIEEYRILLKIGKLINEVNMPSLILPIATSSIIVKLKRD